MVADIGGDLSISSLQDSDYYDSQQKSISGGASFSFGTMTGTLGFGDIGNKAEYSTEHQGAGISTGGSIAENFIGNMANGVLVGAGGEGEASGTTKAAISAGTITIRDTENQQQDVADLSRDVENANDSISPIFDKEKEQKRLEIAQTLGDVGSQAADIARTAGQIEATKAANEKMKTVKPEEREAAKTQWEKDNPGRTATDKDINEQIY